MQNAKPLVTDICSKYQGEFFLVLKGGVGVVFCWGVKGFSFFLLFYFFFLGGGYKVFEILRVFVGYMFVWLDFFKCLNLSRLVSFFCFFVFV